MFLKIFAKHETLKNPLFSDFQNELIHEKEFSRLKKKIKPLHSVVLFLLNWTELSYVPIINTFASEGRKMIDKVIKNHN